VDQRRFTDAVRLGERGDVERAWLELEELLQFYPEQPQVQLFGCTLAQRRHGDTPASRALCARAAALAPADPEPHLAVAESALKAGDRARAQASLLQARSRLGASGNASTAAQPARAALWARAAQLFRQLGQVSRTEEALAQAGAGPELDELRRWAAETRARYGLPPGGARHGIPPESEAEYVEVVQGLLRSIYASRFAEAEAALRRADRRFPRAPGILAARCDLEMRRARYEQAEASCRAALRVYEGASWAHFLLAANLARKGTVAPAIEHYRRAIALDGRLEAAWAMLAQLYRKSGDAAALGELERAYTAAFGRTLPR
jgi:tetratricopeptide (TPR) repeat protein